MQNTEEKYFDIVLADLGQNKFEVIKLLVDQFGVPANEAIQIESKLPYKFKSNASDNEALIIKKKFETVGAILKLYKSRPIQIAVDEIIAENEPLIEKANNKINRLKPSKIKTIKIWLIIGCVLSPMVLGGSLITFLGYWSLIIIGMYILTIPLTIIIINCLKNVSSKKELIFPGIMTLFIISVIAGILILAISDNSFEEKMITQEELKVSSQQLNNSKNKITALSVLSIISLIIFSVILPIIFSIVNSNKYREIRNNMLDVSSSNISNLYSKMIDMPEYYSDMRTIKMEFDYLYTYYQKMHYDNTLSLTDKL